MKIIINVCLFILVGFSSILYADHPGFPVYDDVKFSNSDQIISHTAYTLRYKEDCEQASWVAYKIEYDKLNHTIKRTNDFREDPKVITQSATLQDYRYSGYDRGHLAPAASMKYSKITMSESFYMSNISPQHPGLNRGIWKKLEDKVRHWSSKHGDLYVVSGPVLRGHPNKDTKFIGPNNVCVPEYYYKVILDYNEPEIKAIGFFFPNTTCNEDLEQFAFSIDSIEVITGLDFFPDLPDHIENKIENEWDYSAW